MSFDNERKKTREVKKPTSPQGPNGQCCRDCLFYLVDNAQEYNDCRESSLQIINHGYHIQHNDRGGIEGASFKHTSSWPRSHRLEWCGKFKARKE